jgi:uroporphyrinogen-III synthase
VNTRALHQAAELDALLRARGAQPLSYPCIAIAPPEDAAPLGAGLRGLAAGEFDWLVLTSTNTVLALTGYLKSLELSLRNRPFRTAAVGPATAQAAQEQLGLPVSVLPETYTAAALAEALELQPRARVFLPESAIARPELAEALGVAGALVTVAEAYRTVIGSGGADVPALLRRREVDAVLFTSSSTAQHFLRRLEMESGTPTVLADVCIACIGPQTAQTARDCGLSVAVMPPTHTLEGLVDALERYLNPNSG